MAWIFVPAFGEDFLWYSAAINYLWGTVFACIYIYPFYASCFKETYRMGHVSAVIFILYGFFVGEWGETMGVLAVCAPPLFLGWRRIYRKKWDVKLLLAWLSGIAGFCFLFARPGHGIKTQMSDIKNHLYTSIVLYRRFFWPLIVVWIILAVIFIWKTKDFLKLVKPIIFGIISVGINISTMFSTGYPLRVMLLCSCFLFISVLQLIENYYDFIDVKAIGVNLERICSNGIAIVICFFACICIIQGCKDVSVYRKELREIEEYIMNEYSNGERDIVIQHCPPYDSKYIYYNEYPYFDVKPDNYVNMGYMAYNNYLNATVRLGDYGQLP